MSRTTDTPAFDGRVIFHCYHMSAGKLLAVKQLQEEIEKASPETAKELPGLVGNLVDLLSLTDSIDFQFDGQESGMLLDFRDFWQSYKKATGDKAIKLAVDWRLDTSLIVVNAWIGAINAAHLPYRNGATQPEAALTEIEKGELLKDDSPLG